MLSQSALARRLEERVAQDARLSVRQRGGNPHRLAPRS